MRKAVTAPAVHFKGSGWAKKERRATPAGSTSKGSNDGGSSEGSSSDAAAKADGSTAKADGSTDASGSGSTSASVKPVETGSAAKGD